MLFVEHYFPTELCTFGTALTFSHSLTEAGNNLKALAKIYNERIYERCNGVGHFFSSLDLWNEETLDEFQVACSRFQIQLKRSLWIQRHRKQISNASDVYSMSKFASMMPKFDTLVDHVAEFVRFYGYWGIFPEELFEHFQQVSLRTRSRCSGNTVSA